MEGHPIIGDACVLLHAACCSHVATLLGDDLHDENKNEEGVPSAYGDRLKGGVVLRPDFICGECLMEDESAKRLRPLI